MMPESKGISISRKITDPKERARLKSVVSLAKPPGVGVIIRTEALGVKDSDLQEDFEVLLERWQSIVSMADTAKAPSLLYRDQDLLYRVIREAVTEDVNEIIVDSSFGQQRAQQLLQNWSLDKGIKVNHYTGDKPMMLGTGLDREIRQALQTKVPLPSGGYLYIQQTEALAVIDVNSGKFTRLDSQAETIKLTNLEACKEIARQLRLRNIGGMIIVDFIDMESRANQLQVLETFENELAPDKSKPQIGQLSDLGLVEMTRHRQGQSLNEIFTKKCPSCNGVGFVNEDFNWAPSNLQGDPRQSGRFGNRHKLPLKSSRKQNVPKLKDKKNQQKGGRGDNRGRQQDKENKNGKSQQDLLEAGNIFYVQKRDSESNVRNWKEHYEERMDNELGVKLAHVAKLSVTPPDANSVLSRINPRANDILTLVRTIEESPEISGDGDVVNAEDVSVREVVTVGGGKKDNDGDVKAEVEEKGGRSRGRGGTAVADRDKDEDKDSGRDRRKSGNRSSGSRSKKSDTDNKKEDDNPSSGKQDEKAESNDDNQDRDDKSKKRRGRPPKKSNRSSGGRGKN